jgi:succinate dehydrogenase / fumarate reductase cytochrome b subunit
VKKVLNLLVQYYREHLLNPHLGMKLFLLQRITGVGIAFYLLMHMTVIGSVRLGPASFDRMMVLVSEPAWLFKPLEVVLMAALLLHGLNGLRITILDFGSLARHHRVSIAVMAAAFVPLVAIGGYLFLSHIAQG